MWLEFSMLVELSCILLCFIVIILLRVMFFNIVKFVCLNGDCVMVFLVVMMKGVLEERN